MQVIIDFLAANWQTIIGILTGIVTVASAIANLTPTQTDNKIVEYVSKAINWLALNFKPKA